MRRRWRAWVWGVLPSVVGYGVCLGMVVVPTVLLASAWHYPPPPPTTWESEPDGYKVLLREGGPAVFAEVADGRWRKGDPADALTAAHPPDLTLVRGSRAWHYYHGNGTNGVRALVVMADEGRLALGWVVCTVGDKGWFGRGMVKTDAPLPLRIGDEREVLDDDVVRLDSLLGLVALTGPLGAVFEP